MHKKTPSSFVKSHASTSQPRDDKALAAIVDKIAREFDPYYMDRSSIDNLNAQTIEAINALVAVSVSAVKGKSPRRPGSKAAVREAAANLLGLFPSNIIGPGSYVSEEMASDGERLIERIDNAIKQDLVKTAAAAIDRFAADHPEIVQKNLPTKTKMAFAEAVASYVMSDDKVMYRKDSEPGDPEEYAKRWDCQLEDLERPLLQKSHYRENRMNGAYQAVVAAFQQLGIQLDGRMRNR